MIIRTAVVIATLIIVIAKNHKSNIDRKNENSRSEAVIGSYNRTSVIVRTILKNNNS